LRLEAGSIAALQAELAREMPSHPHLRVGLGHAGGHHAAGAHLAHGGAHHLGAHLAHSHPGAHHSHSGGHHSHSGGLHSHAGAHHTLSSKHLWEPPPPMEQANLAVHPLQFTFRVHGSKFLSKDRQVVSEMFHVRVGDAKVPFRVRVIARSVHSHKHGQCFRTARGRGRLELKCEGEVPERAERLRFAFGVGSGEARERRCEPVEHDFLGSPVGGLPQAAEDWDFRAATDPDTSSCPITLEVFASTKPHAHLSTIAEDAPENFV